MKINEIKCKTALSNSRLPGLDYSLNPYRGCQHNCCYCYVPNILRIDRSQWGSFVDVKKNIPVVLSNELRKKKPGVVGISTVTDPYQPVEKKYDLTRYCLEQILIHDLPVHIQTKSDLVLKDTDLISKFSDVEVMFSIATLNDYERKILEPYSSSIQNRLKAMRKLSDNGIKTTVFFGPIYPTVKKEDLPIIIDKFIENGAEEIMVDKFNLKPGIRENTIHNIKRNPILLDTFMKNIDNSNYFENIRDKLMESGKNKNIRIIDAF